MHPDFKTLTEYALGDENVAQKEHIDSCERCSTIVEGIKIANREALKSGGTLDDFLEDSQDRTRSHLPRISGSKPVSRKIWPWLAAATLMLGFGLSYILLPQNGLDQSVTDRLSEYYPAPVVVRGQLSDAAWQRFITKYKEQDFDAAYAIITSLDPDLSQVKYYRALCLMYKTEPDFTVAADLLLQLTASANRFDEQARWFLSLALIKQRKLEEAKQVLSGIVEFDKHYKKKEALQLLEQL